MVAQQVLFNPELELLSMRSFPYLKEFPFSTLTTIIYSQNYYKYTTGRSNYFGKNHFSNILNKLNI